MLGILLYFIIALNNWIFHVFYNWIKIVVKWNIKILYDVWKKTFLKKTFKKTYFCRSFHPSVLLTQRFLGIRSSAFSNFCNGIHMKLCMTKQYILREMFCPNNGQKWTKKGFFEAFEIFEYYFCLNSVYNESSYYLLCFCTNPISEKNLILEIWTKMLLSYQTAWFIRRWRWSKRVSHSGHVTLKLALCHVTLKLALSEEGIDRVNWFLCMLVQIHESENLPQ